METVLKTMTLKPKAMKKVARNIKYKKSNVEKGLETLQANQSFSQLPVVSLPLHTLDTKIQYTSHQYPKIVWNKVRF